MKKKPEGEGVAKIGMVSSHKDVECVTSVKNSISGKVGGSERSIHAPVSRAQGSNQPIPVIVDKNALPKVVHSKPKGKQIVPGEFNMKFPLPPIPSPFVSEGGDDTHNFNEESRVMAKSAGENVLKKGDGSKGFRTKKRCLIQLETSSDIGSHESEDEHLMHSSSLRRASVLSLMSQ